MKKILFTIIILTIIYIDVTAQQKIKLVTNSSDKKVDVLIGGKLFTTYRYSNNTKKPVLWPVITAGGNEITRQFPLNMKAGERADHPHHTGVWLNYGDVNGLDFWGNSGKIAPGKANKYGTIYHESIESETDGKGKATLVTTASWKDNNGKKILSETSEYTFIAKGKTRIIDRTTLLKAVGGKVNFNDSKEGMFAIRVTRALELPATGKIRLTGLDGNVVEVDTSEDITVTGNYLSSNGVKGADVWGTRANWMKLYGEVNGEKVAVVIFDHPANIGYPTYWHARSYGLFAANPLGQKVFSKGKEELNFSIENGKIATFRYRLAIFSGEPTLEEINKMAKEFESKI